MEPKTVGGTLLICAGFWRLRQLKAIDKLALLAFGGGCALLALPRKQKEQRHWTHLRTASDEEWKREFDSLTDPKARGFLSECWIRYRLEEDNILPTFFSLFGYQNPKDYFLHDTCIPEKFVAAIPKYSVWFDEPAKLNGVEIEKARHSLGIKDLFIADVINQAAIIGRGRTTEECRNLLKTCDKHDHLLRQAAILNWLYSDSFETSELFKLITQEQFHQFHQDAKERVAKKYEFLEIDFAEFSLDKSFTDFDSLTPSKKATR